MLVPVRSCLLSSLSYYQCTQTSRGAELLQGVRRFLSYITLTAVIQQKLEMSKEGLSPTP